MERSTAETLRSKSDGVEDPWKQPFQKSRALPLNPHRHFGIYRVDGALELQGFLQTEAHLSPEEFKS